MFTKIIPSTGAKRAFAYLTLILTAWLAACASGQGIAPTDHNPVEGAQAAKATDAVPFMPAGVNQPCPNAAASAPVVLVHGTFANAQRAFKTLAPMLMNRDVCVFALNYGKRSTLPSVYATADMSESAEEIRAFIETVRTRTGAAQVDLVGHSQGGTLVLYLGQQAHTRSGIRRIVAISPSVRGTTTAKMLPEETTCVACRQQATDAEFIRRLNAEPVNPARIPTLILATDNDRVVTPVQSQFIHEPAVTNIRLQQLLPGRFATHSGILHDSDAMRFVTDWLTGKGADGVLKPPTP